MNFEEFNNDCYKKAIEKIKCANKNRVIYCVLPTGPTAPTGPAGVAGEVGATAQG